MAKEQPGIIVTFANSGTTIPLRTFIIAMIVVYAGKAGVLARISSIARCVIIHWLYNYLTRFRPVVLVCPWQWSTPTNVSSEFRTAIVPSAASTCSIPHHAWSSCCAAIAYTRHVGMSI